MSAAEDLASVATRWHQLPPGPEKDAAKAEAINITRRVMAEGSKATAVRILQAVIPGWAAALIVGASEGALKVFGPRFLPPGVMGFLTGGRVVSDPDPEAPYISVSVEQRLMRATARIKGRTGAGLVEIIGPQGAGKTALGFRIAEVLGKPIYVVEYPAALLEGTPLKNCAWTGRALNALHNCTLVIPDSSMFLDAYDAGGRMQRAFGNLVIFAGQRDCTIIVDLHASSFVLRRTHALVRATFYRGMVNVEHGELGERDELLDVSRKARESLLTVPAFARKGVTYARFSDALQGLMRVQLPQTFTYSQKFSKAREGQSLFGFGKAAKEAMEEEAVDAEFTAGD